MSLPSDVRTRLGEREFLDYPVFTDADGAERNVVLRRALIAALGLGVIALALIISIR